MDLLGFINRSPIPEPWAEGDNIPWNDPAFSERMLLEHLSQQHDAASRRFEKIDRQVAWIHGTVLGRRPAPILDLGCGPGLYATRLARLGHHCTGIDFSPASVRYARELAGQDHLPCTFIGEDIRQAVYGSGFGLVMLIYGEFNVFRPSDAQHILNKAFVALAPGGTLLLEPSTFAATEAIGRAPAEWVTKQRGLFLDQPHVYFEERTWDPVGHTATKRIFILDAATAQVQRYASTYQAYTELELQTLLESCHFGDVHFYPSLLGVPDPVQSSFIAVTACRA